MRMMGCTATVYWLSWFVTQVRPDEAMTSSLLTMLLSRFFSFLLSCKGDHQSHPDVAHYRYRLCAEDHHVCSPLSLSRKYFLIWCFSFLFLASAALWACFSRCSATRCRWPRWDSSCRSSSRCPVPQVTNYDVIMSHQMTSSFTVALSWLMLMAMLAASALGHFLLYEVRVYSFLSCWSSWCFRT